MTNRILEFLSDWPEQPKQEEICARTVISADATAHACPGFDSGQVRVQLLQEVFRGEVFTDVRISAPGVMRDANEAGAQPVFIALHSPAALKALVCALVELMSEPLAQQILSQVKPLSTKAIKEDEEDEEDDDGEGEDWKAGAT